jgi:hypothetical protein
MDAMIGEAGPTCDDTEKELPDYEYIGDSIMEDLLANVPKLQETTKQKLIFIRGLFVRFLIKDLLPVEAITDETRHPIRERENRATFGSLAL